MLTFLIFVAGALIGWYCTIPLFCKVLSFFGRLEVRRANGRMPPYNDHWIYKDDVCPLYPPPFRGENRINSLFAIEWDEFVAKYKDN